MVNIYITEDDKLVKADCQKATGGCFTLLIDKNTKELLEIPENADIDVSCAYSHILQLLKKGIPLPKETSAAWG